MGGILRDDDNMEALLKSGPKKIKLHKMYGTFGIFPTYLMLFPSYLSTASSGFDCFSSCLPCLGYK